MNNTAFGAFSNATGGATTLGWRTTAFSLSTAIGSQTTAAGTGSVAIGNSAWTYDNNSVAIGSNAFTYTAGGVAIGQGAYTAGAGIAIGQGASSQGSGLAIGTGASASGINSVVIGANSNDGGQTSVVSVGSASQTRRITNVAAGVNATDAVTVGQLMSVFGGVAATYSSASPLQSVAKQAVGATASTSLFAADGSVTETADATGTHAVAAGANALASGNQSTALGANANAPASNSVALGANSTADRDNTVSVGAAGSERQITNVAAGTQGTDAVNLNQLNGAMASSVAQSERYTDRGVAAALAIPSVPMLARGEHWVGASVGGYGSAQALGVSAAYQATQNLNVALGVSTAVNSGGSVAWRAQAGYRW